MPAPRSLQFARHGALLALGVWAIGLAGCNALARWGNAVFVHCAESHDLAEVRHDTRRELSEQLIDERRQAAEREVELARYEAERRQMERQFCIAHEEAFQQQLRSNIRQQLESKVAFNVTQEIEIGELEVDTEKLKELMVQREQQPVVEPFQQPPKCPCCDEPCRCGSGHKRRHCPHCRHKPCEAEQKCGGPEAFRQLQQQPFRQPLRPAEIPMKLPVYLNFGMQQPQMERARIRQQPMLREEFREQFKQPCPCDAPVGGMPCVAPVGPPMQPPPATSYPPRPPAPLPGGDIRPPVPVADPAEQARRMAHPQPRVAVRLAPANNVQPATCVEPVPPGVLR